MSTKRIKDLTTTAYNGSYKIAVDDETNGTKSIELSSVIYQAENLTSYVKTVNGISPGGNGDVNLGYEENELVKFKEISSINQLSSEDIRQGYVYYIRGGEVEGCNADKIDSFYIASNTWSFTTAKMHTVSLNAGNYRFDVQSAKGGDARLTVQGYGQKTRSGGQSISANFSYTFDNDTVISVTIGSNGSNGTDQIDSKGFGEATGTNGSQTKIISEELSVVFDGGTGAVNVWNPIKGQWEGTNGADGEITTKIPSELDVLCCLNSGTPYVKITKI